MKPFPESTGLVHRYRQLKIRKSITGDVELHFRGVFSVDVANDDFVFPFIVRLDFTHAKRN